MNWYRHPITDVHSAPAQYMLIILFYIVLHKITDCHVLLFVIFIVHLCLQENYF